MKNQRPLTSRQKQIYEWIEAQLVAGNTVGVRAIAHHFEFNLSAASVHCRLLVDKGFLIYHRGKANGIQLAKPILKIAKGTEKDEVVVHTTAPVTVKRSEIEAMIRQAA